MGSRSSSVLADKSSLLLVLRQKMEKNIELFSGSQMPLVGLGTWHHGSQQEMSDAVRFAIKEGFRHIDCAYCYGNEKEMGEVFTEMVGENKFIAREKMFIASKLWNTEHAGERVEAACRKTLEDLCLDYLDLYIIHWPSGFVHGKGNVPRDDEGKMVLFSGVSIEETWLGMEKLVHLGLVKAIGLSNFNSKQILRILEVAKVRPAVLQVESNPRFANEPLRRFCARHSINMVAFSPFGSPDLPWGEKLPHILSEPKLVELAAKLKRSPAQVVLRWQIQRGVGVIPKSVFPNELTDNLGVWGWTLDQGEMEVLNKMETGVRKIVPIITLPGGEQKIRDIDDINIPFSFTEADSD